MRIVTVSRMFGSNGSEVARRVSVALGWTLLDNDIIDTVAARLGLPAAIVSQRDERLPPIGERLANALALGTPEMMPAVTNDSPPLTEDRVLAMTKHVISEAVNQGPLVVVGRGAQCLLSTRHDALHVFCYATPELLAKHVMEAEKIPLAAAEKRVHEMNRQREQYVERQWGRRWRSMENYHLMLNVGSLGTQCAADLVVAAVRNAEGT